MSSRRDPEDSPSSLKTEDEYHIETCNPDDESIEEVNPPAGEDELEEVEEDDDDSAASSAGSLVPPNVEDLIDLTDDTLCRVKYRRRVDGKDIEVVCGTHVADCRRKRHDLWRLNPATRCGPGFYYPVIKRNGDV